MENWVTEHLALLVGAMALFFGLASFVLASQYRKIIDKLDGIDHPIDGYVTKIACKEKQDSCVGAKCTEKIEKMFYRIDRKLERNGAVIFILADLLIAKKVLDGEDLLKLRDRFEQYRERDES